MLLTLISFSQESKVLFSGAVKDTNGVELSYATVRIVGTTIGTVSDSHGKFELLLSPGKHKFLFSYVGFKPYIASVELYDSVKKEIRLYPNDIQLSEVLIDGEEPAYSIVREAIKRKKRWMELITSYKARTYTKDTFGRDTSLVLISEAYSDLYHQKGDSLREIVVHRRQSSNLSEEFQLAIIRDFINFNNDTIRHWGYTFITPLAESAFQFYDYKLQRTYSNDGALYHDIEVFPISKTRPLFSGIISIADSSYALQKVSVFPNNIFQVPLLSIGRFEFSQQFSLYENKYWLPIEYHISAEVRFRFFNMTIDTNALYYNKSVICYEYSINSSIEDSIQLLPSLTLLAATHHDDTSQWGNVIIFPLTAVEQKSYKRIDEIVKSQPFYFQLPKYYKQYEEQLELLDIRYNRIEGLFLGGILSHKINSAARFTINAGVGSADKKIKYKLKPEILISSQYSIWCGVENYNEIYTAPINYKVDELSNSLASFFDGDDYYNYFISLGNRVFVSYDKYENITATFSLIHENQRSIIKETDFSLKSIGSKYTLRNNPLITEGKLVSLLLDCYTNREFDNGLFNEPKKIWHVRAEQTLPRFGSTFNFTSLYLSFTFRIPTMGRVRLFNPYLGISTSIGKSFGVIPLQRTFALESPLSRYAFPGSFRTVRNSEFSGDNFYALSVEHNFRNIPFILIGIPSINLDLITRAATSEIWITSPSLNNTLQPLTANYNEYTIGIGRIADIFRIDFSYSNYQKSRYVLTFTGYL